MNDWCHRIASRIPAVGLELELGLGTVRTRPATELKTTSAVSLRNQNGDPPRHAGCTKSSCDGASSCCSSVSEIAWSGVSSF